MRRYTVAAMSIGLGLAVPIVFAAAAKPEVQVVRGTAQVQQANGSWVESSKVSQGCWVRAAQSDTTVRLPGVTVRLEKGSSVRVSKLDASSALLDAKGGRIFVRVAPKASCVVAMQSRRVEASESEFVLDAGSEESLYLLAGQAQFVGQRTPAKPLAFWSKEGQIKVALDGPDVRKRNRNRRRFTQGEENKGKRIGEDETPTQSISPTVTQSPAYTPSPSLTPPTPSPTPPPQQNPPPQATGGNPWPWLGPVIGAGVGTTVFLVTRDKGSNDPNVVVRPASP